MSSNKKETSTETLDVTPQSKAYGYIKVVAKFLLSQWFYIILAALIAIAAEYPNFARHGGTIKAEYSISYGAVALIFLQNGLSMRTATFLAHLGNWRSHIIALVMQFLVTGSIVFGLCSAIKACNNKNIDNWMLVGAIVTSTCPTTIASNVMMTRQAKGSAEKTISAVFAGNLFGAFFSPLLVQMYLSSPGWDFGNPKNGSSFAEVYKRVMKQLGLSVFLPLFVGQCILNLNPEKILAINAKYKLNKVGSVCLLLNLFASFSTAFYQKAFSSVPGASVIMIFFLNVGLYLLFSVITFLISRNILIKKYIIDKEKKEALCARSKSFKLAYRFLAPFYFSPEDAISLLFVCPAKTAALGISLTTSQYGPDFPYLGKLLSALVLYQTEQVLIANFIVIPCRRWINRLQKQQRQKKTEEKEPDEDSETGATKLLA